MGIMQASVMGRKLKNYPRLTNEGQVLVNGDFPAEFYKEITEEIVRLAAPILVGTGDLINYGLVTRVTQDAFYFDYMVMDKMEGASISLDPIVDGARQGLSMKAKSFPLVCFYQTWQMSSRVKRIIDNNFVNIDDEYLAVAVQTVSVEIEKTLFNGIGESFDGKWIYGYTNHPKRKTGDLRDWSNVNDLKEARNDVIEMIKAMNEVRNVTNSSLVLYVARDFYYELSKYDKDINLTMTVLNSILTIPEIRAVRLSSNLENASAVLVHMDKSSVSLFSYLDIGNLQTETSMTDFNSMVLAIQTPLIKEDYKDQVGIVHWKKP